MKNISDDDNDNELNLFLQRQSSDDFFCFLQRVSMVS